MVTVTVESLLGTYSLRQRAIWQSEAARPCPLLLADAGASSRRSRLRNGIQPPQKRQHTYIERPYVSSAVDWQFSASGVVTDGSPDNEIFSLHRSSEASRRRITRRRPIRARVQYERRTVFSEPIATPGTRPRMLQEAEHGLPQRRSKGNHSKCRESSGSICVARLAGNMHPVRPAARITTATAENVRFYIVERVGATRLGDPRAAATTAPSSASNVRRVRTAKPQ